jgi:hypothetical protein
MAKRIDPLPSFPERTMTIAGGSVLTDQEISDLIATADERKRRGETWIQVDTTEEGWRLIVPNTMKLTRQEAVMILSRANEAKEHAHSTFELAFQDGHIVANRLAFSNRGMNGAPSLILGGTRRPQQF